MSVCSSRSGFSDLQARAKLAQSSESSSLYPRRESELGFEDYLPIERESQRVIKEDQARVTRTFQ